LQQLDGVMVGREAYHNPWWLASWDAAFFGAPAGDGVSSREAVEERMCNYMVHEAALNGTPWNAIARHMLGLRHGLVGSRRWRQVWSDHKLKAMHPRDVMVLAHLPVQRDDAADLAMAA
jgi:tRNA-dihydrouridine synthase A